MINLYQLLNIEPNASEKSIQAGIALYRLRADANEKVIHAARTYLLNPTLRQAYDQKLFHHLGVTPPTEDAQITAKPSATHAIDKKLIPTTQHTDFENWYQFLGIRTQASYADIADAIDEAVLEGLNGKHIQDARLTLLDPSARAAYDAAHNIDSAASILVGQSADTIAKPQGFSITKWFQKQRKTATPPSQPANHTVPTATSLNTIPKNDAANAQNTEVITTDPSSPVPIAKPAPAFKRDNWYHFLGIRGDATYQEIKIAIRTARLKGRDKELIKQAQNMLLRPSNRRLYDQHNHISVFIAAQNGNIHQKVKATDYRLAPQIMGNSLQKIFLALFACVGLASGFLPWLANVAGLRLMLAWPLLITCIITIACIGLGHKQDPLYRKAHFFLSASLLPAVWVLSWVTWSKYQMGMHWGVAAMIGLLLTPILWRAQSRNVSFRASWQQGLALLALVFNVLWALICWQQWTQHGL